MNDVIASSLVPDGLLPPALDPAAPLGALLVLGAVLVCALLAHAATWFVLDRITRRTPGVADTAAVRRTRAPGRVLLLLVAARLWPLLLPSDAFVPEALRRAMDVAIILTVTWMLVRAVAVIDDVILRRHRVDVRDNLEARRVHTQTRILSRTVMMLVVVVGVAVAMMTFPAVRRFGASLLASAGIAGLVIGLAARPTIGSCIAGIQLALTQPIRIDDVLIVEGEWGRVEEITATYVVVRIWDERRLIVPLQYFIETPFQNWTRTSADILGTVELHADYAIPVDEVRAELRRIVEDADAWDGRTCALQVTGATERTLTLRALVSAADSSRAWELRCLVRERLLGWMQARHPECLPRVRAEVDQRRGSSGAEA